MSLFPSANLLLPVAIGHAAKNAWIMHSMGVRTETGRRGWRANVNGKGGNGNCVFTQQIFFLTHCYVPDTGLSVLDTLSFVWDL